MIARGICLGLAGLLTLATTEARAVPVDCGPVGLCIVSAGVGEIELEESPGNGRAELEDWRINGEDQLFSTRWAIDVEGTYTFQIEFGFVSATADDVSNTLRVDSTIGDVDLVIEYILAPDGRSLTERATVTNNGSPADIVLLARTDYDLAESASDEFSIFDPVARRFTQTDPLNGVEATWTAVTGDDGWEQDSDFDDFQSGLVLPLANASLMIGPEDVAQAFAFELTLQQGASRVVELRKTVNVNAAVPLPLPAALLLSGLGVFGVLRARRGA